MQSQRVIDGTPVTATQIAHQFKVDLSNARDALVKLTHRGHLIAIEKPGASRSYAINVGHNPLITKKWTTKLWS